MTGGALRLTGAFEVTSSPRTPYAASAPLTELARDREGLRLFLASPAAQVMSWAEQSFPVFEVAQVADACPLAQPPARTPRAALDGAPQPGRTAIVLTAVGMLLVGVVSLRPVRRSSESAS